MLFNHVFNLFVVVGVGFSRINGDHAFSEFEGDVSFRWGMKDILRRDDLVILGIATNDSEVDAEGS